MRDKIGGGLDLIFQEFVVENLGWGWCENFFFFFDLLRMKDRDFEAFVIEIWIIAYLNVFEIWIEFCGKKKRRRRNIIWKIFGLMNEAYKKLKDRRKDEKKYIFGMAEVKKYMGLVIGDQLEESGWSFLFFLFDLDHPVFIRTTEVSLRWWTTYVEGRSIVKRMLIRGFWSWKKIKEVLCERT